MRILSTIILVILILVLIYIQSRLIVDRVKFKFSFRGVNLASLNLSNFINIGQTSVNTSLGLNIKNENNFSIRFSNLKTWLYYDGNLVAETSEDLLSKSFIIPSKGQLDVVDNVNMYVNLTSTKLIQQVLSHRSPTVEYTVNVNIYGIPFTFKNNFNWD